MPLSHPWLACDKSAHLCPFLYSLCGFLALQDKINAFWEILKKDLDDRKAELRNKDREMEEMEERHQVEIKVRKCHLS